jgi:hypothetical protein
MGFFRLALVGSENGLKPLSGLPYTLIQQSLISCATPLDLHRFW